MDPERLVEPHLAAWPEACELVLSAVFPGAAHGVSASALEGLLIQIGRTQRPPDESSPAWSYAPGAALPAWRQAIVHLAHR